MTMEDSLLSLRWNNHRSTFLHTLANLHGKEYCSDATVACDGKLYPVHKIVLSTCSDYFEAMMNMTHQSQHPFIVLKDVRQEDLEALLSYMYIGEVQVSQGDLAGLLKAAECLRIKGLAVPDEEPKSSENKRPATDDRHRSTSASKRRRSEANSDSNEGSRCAVTTDTPQSSPSTPVAPFNPPSTSSTPEKSVAGGDTQNAETSDAVEQERKEETQSEEFGRTEIQMTQGSNTRQEDEEGEQYTLMKEEIASVKEEPFDDVLLQQHIASLPTVHITNNTVNQNDGVYSQMLGVKQDGAMVWDNRPPTTQEYSISASTSSTSTDFSHNRPLPFPQPHQMQHGGQLNEVSIPAHLQGLGKALVMPTRPQDHEGGGHTDGGGGNGSGGGVGGLGRPWKQLLCPFPDCGYVTDRESWLKTHVRKHTGEKPFMCPFCPYRSAQKSNLTVHIKKQHGWPIANAVVNV